MYAVSVIFDVEPASRAGFLGLVAKQAANSLRLESGCHTFDVWTDSARPEIFLYEIYASRAAFEAHLESDHFKSFDGAVATMVRSKSVVTYDAAVKV